MDLKEQLYRQMKEGGSLFLIGPGDSGKSWFVIHELVPFLQEKGFLVSYVPNCEDIQGDYTDSTCVIIDEVETLQDKEFLEQQHPKEVPYYSTAYLNAVASRFIKLQQIKRPCVYVVSRNSPVEINNFISKIKTTDWDGRQVVCLEFVKSAA